MSDFVTTRINVIKDESPAGKALFGIPNTVMTKRIGKDSFLLLRSAWESNLGEGIDADMLVLDEKDRMKEGIDIAFKESLSGGGAGLIREISTPTLPDKGINELYLKSDQHEWHVRCERCGLEQTIEYPDNMIQVKDFSEGCQDLPKGAYEYACRKLSCRGPLNRLDGRWVAKYPEKTVIRGYFIPQLIAPWISATDVMQKKITYRFLQPWQNYVLGKTSLGESTLLTDADADRSTSNYQLLHGRSSAWKNISVGIDWGNMNWVVVVGRNENGLTYVIGIFIAADTQVEMESTRRIINYIKPFKPNVIIADAGYGKDRNAAVLRTFGPDKFWRCEYNPSPKSSKTFNPVWQPAQNSVMVDRTMTLKETTRSVREQEVGLPNPSDDKVMLLRKHLLNLVPFLEEEEGEFVETVRKLGDDHLSHCLAYALLGQSRIEGTRKFNFDFVETRS
jgi:hypothetical protein